MVCRAARRTLWADVDLSTPDTPEKIARIGCGAMVGLVVGFALAVGTLSYYANSVATFVVVICLSVAACAILALSLGDRFFKFLHKYFQWF
jgi:hypothetical protein